MWLQGDPRCHGHHQELQRHQLKMHRAQLNLQQIPPINVNSPERPLHLLLPANGAGASSCNSTIRRVGAAVPDSDDGLLRFPNQRKASAPRTPMRADGSWIRSFPSDGNGEDVNDEFDSEQQQPAHLSPLPSPPMPPPPPVPQHQRPFVKLPQPPPLPPPPTAEELLIRRSHANNAIGVVQTIANRKVIDWQLKHSCQSSFDKQHCTSGREQSTPRGEPSAVSRPSPPEHVTSGDQPPKQPLRRANNWADGLDKAGGNSRERFGHHSLHQHLNKQRQHQSISLENTRKCVENCKTETERRDANDTKKQHAIASAFREADVTTATKARLFGVASASTKHHQSSAGLDDQALQNFRRVQLELQAPLRLIKERLRSDGHEAVSVDAMEDAADEDKILYVASPLSVKRQVGRHRCNQSSIRKHHDSSALSRAELYRLERQLDDLRADSRLAQRNLERQVSDCHQQAELANTAANAVVAAVAADAQEKRRCSTCSHRRHQAKPETEAALARARRELRRRRRQAREELAREARLLERRCDRLRLQLGEFGRRLASCDNDIGCATANSVSGSDWELNEAAAALAAASLTGN